MIIIRMVDIIDRTHLLFNISLILSHVLETLELLCRPGWVVCSELEAVGMGGSYLLWEDMVVSSIR